MSSVDDREGVPWNDRLVATAVVGAAVWAVWTLARLDPDARGHGTHEQLGMEPCGWPLLPPVGYGIPCPTCGCTTAATHLVHLDPIEAVATQPFGTAVAVAGLWLAFVALRSLLRGEAFLQRLARLPIATITIATVASMLLGWAYTYWTWPSAP